MFILYSLKSSDSFKEQLSTMIQDNNWEWVSFIEYVNSDKVILRIWFIFKDKMHLKIWFDALKNVENVEEAKKNHITVSNNEWISNKIDLNWLQKCFESELTKQQQEKFHLLIINKHVFHLTNEAIIFCKKNYTILLCLSSHSIDLLQSLNVEVFLSLIIIYKLKLEAFTWLNAEYSINKSNFIKLYL